jgi:GNAT superfamily N-acetyltransferase
MEPWALELLGYVASVLVAVSLTMSSIVRLRVINLAGSLAFTVYGYLIVSYPVAVVNLFIAFVNIYFLRRMLASQEYFRLLELRPDSEYLRFFLAHYADQIRRFFPGFSPAAADASLGLFVLRDMVPAGLLLGDVRDGTLDVRLDFVIPQFRDFKIGKYLFEERADYFRERGIHEIRSPRGSDAHVSYLARMGFRPVGGDEGDAFFHLRLP